MVGASEELRRAALDGFQPNTVFAFSDEPTDAVPLLAGKPLVDGRPAAYVCERFACQAPETSPDALRGALEVTAPGLPRPSSVSIDLVDVRVVEHSMKGEAD